VDISVTIAQGSDGWQVAVRAEQLGYKTAWFEDSQMVAADPIAMMAIAAIKTSTINLASGVLIPSNRIAPQTANSFATLNNLAPGRVIMGVGTGFSGRRAMGLGPVKVADIRSYIKTVNGLLRGEIVEWNFEGKQRKIGFLHPHDGVINTVDKVPTYLAAQGPRMRRLVAELATNWVNVHSNIATARSDMDAMELAWQEVEAKASSFNKAIVTAGCPLLAGETADCPKAMRQGGPLAAVTFHNMLEAEQYGNAQIGSPGKSDPLEQYRKVYEKYLPSDARYLSLHRGHSLFVRDDEAKFITADLIQKTTMTGPVDEIRERVQELKIIGYDELSVIIHPGDDDMLERWADVMAKL
jgi:5,10-methylenetetrahydromethanopterin reductase